MGNALPRTLGLSHADYFALERSEYRRYEYLAGEVFAMAGDSERHALISMNSARQRHPPTALPRLWAGHEAVHCPV